MGLDVYLSWIAGVRVTKRKVDVTVRKFDPDTGEPYNRIEKHDLWFLPDDVTSIDQAKLAVLSEADILHNTDDGHMLIGIEVDLLGSHRGDRSENAAPFPSSIAQLSLVVRASKLLKEYDIPDPPTLWIVQTISY